MCSCANLGVYLWKLGVGEGRGLRKNVDNFVWSVDAFTSLLDRPKVNKHITCQYEHFVETICNLKRLYTFTWDLLEDFV